MKKEAQFYSMIEENNVNKDSIKRNIKYLKKLKYDDMLPLLVYLYMELLQRHIEELDKIIDLLVDFMFRYRIVKPYTGGGPLKKLVLNLLTKLKNNEIELTYDKILYELSNSPESNQRYPDDDEFKSALINGDKDEYKREILLRLEDKETKNIKIDVEDKDLTLEHLMPKTKTNWWVKNMGGKEKYQLALQNYLKSIGNLAILSRGYNSVNSNDPWNDKLVQLSTAQFKVTQEVSKNKNWKEQEIIDRNKKISRRLCKIITSPLPRERDLEFIKTNDGNYSDFEAGVYDIFDTEFPDSHLAITEVQIADDKIKISSWRELFNKICKCMMEDNKNLFESIVLNNLIHKRKSSKGTNQKDPVITKEPDLLQKSLRIENTEFYTEAVLSQSRVLEYSRQLIEAMNFDKKILLVLEG